MRSLRGQLLGSASAVAVILTFGGGLIVSKAQAETINRSGSALWPNNTGALNPANTFLSVDAIAPTVVPDTSEIVTLDGLVTATSVFPHMDAFGLFIDGGAGAFYASDSGNSALATNSVTGTGYISGPGQSSYGTTVAGFGNFGSSYGSNATYFNFGFPPTITAGVEAQAASAGSFDTGLSGAINRSAKAVNSVGLTGTVGGGSSMSGGFAVEGLVDSAFAEGYVNLDFTGAAAAVGTAQAQNLLALTGTVGGSGASDGSYGLGIFANPDPSISDLHNGAAFATWAEAFGTMTNLGNGSAADLVANASNVLGIEGDIVGSGGSSAAGVTIGSFAESSFAGAYGTISGYDSSSLVGAVQSSNTIDVAGRNLASGTSITGSAGVSIANQVEAVFSEAYSAGVLTDDTTGTFTPFVRTEASAFNNANVNGTVGTGVSGSDNYGVHIGGYVTSFDAYAAAGSTLAFDQASVNHGTVQADALAQNLVSVGGTGGLYPSAGVWVGEDIYAADAYAYAYVVADATASSSGGNTISGIGNATATNSVGVGGYVTAPGSSGSTGVGVDGYFGTWTSYGAAAEYADAYSYVTVSAVGGAEGPAIAYGSGNSYAQNLVDVTGSLAPSVANSTGVTINASVFAESAYAYNFTTVTAAGPGGTVAGLGSSATAVGNSSAVNGVTITGLISSNGVSVAGVDPLNVYAEGAYSYNYSYATANASVGPAVASAQGFAYAANLVSVTGSLGSSVTSGVGVGISGDVFAEGAYAYNQTSVTATTGGGTLAALGATATGLGSATALNGVSITGTIGDNSAGSFGVDPAYVAAYDATAFSNVVVSSEATLNGIALASAEGSASASNLISIAGAVGASVTDSVGVSISADVYADYAYASNDVSVTASKTGDTIVGLGASASGSGSAVAFNGVTISGSVGDNSTGSYGVDPGYVYSYGAESDDSVTAVATASIDGSAVADSQGSAFSGNLVSITGVVGTSVTGSAGVSIAHSAYAQNAHAYDYAYASASAVGSSLGVSPGATATAGGDATALNGVYISGVVGNNSSLSAGVDPASVFASYANAYDTVTASATSSIGGPALATAANSVFALNLVDVSGSVGDTVANSNGVEVNGDIYAYSALAQGSAYAMATVNNAGQTIGTGGATADASGLYFAANIVSVEGTVGTQSAFSNGVSVNPNGYGGVFADYAYGSGYVEAIANSMDSGPANASAEGLVAGLNFVAISGTVGNALVHDTVATHDSTGVSIQGEGTAYNAQAYGQVYASAMSSIGGNTINTGGAIADATGDVYAVNGVAISGMAVAEGYANVGVSLSDYVGSYNAEASGYTDAYASVTNGDAASATATGNVLAGNYVQIGGIVGNYNSLSTGVAIGGDVYASGATAEGGVNASAVANDLVAPVGVGGATAWATGTVAAVNQVSIAGSVGTDGYYANPMDVDDIGVSIGNTVYADGAYASGQGYAGATSYNGNAALAQTTLDTSAANSVAISGTVGPWSSMSDGVDIAGDVYAANATVYFSYANASAYSSLTNAPSVTTFGATAIADGQSAAANSVTIYGGVGDNSSGNTLSNSYGVDPQNVYAENALAYGSSSAEATAYNGGDALALANGSVLATNTVAIVGVVGTSTTNYTGVGLNGTVYATNAEGIGAVGSFAGAYLNGYGPTLGGGATATANGLVLATNGIYVSGMVGDGSTLGYGVDGATEIYATNAAAFGLVQSESVSWASNLALAEATGTVQALNTIAVIGNVGQSVTDGTGVYVGGDIYAANAEAAGNVYASAISYVFDTLHSGGATAIAAGAVTASNGIVIAGIVGDYNQGSFGVDPAYVYARNASASGSVEADAVVTGSYGTIGASASATGYTDASNYIAITGSVGNWASTVTGVDVTGTVSASSASATNFVTSSAISTVSSATSSATGGAIASNGVHISGSVGDNSVYSYGVDPQLVYASGATASNSLTSTATSTLGGPATANGLSSAYAGNIVSITGSLGTSVSNSTGVYGNGDAYAEGAYATDTATITAMAYGNTIAGFGATASATASATALNSVALSGTIGDYGSQDSGIAGTGWVYSNMASASNVLLSSATSSIGGPAVADGTGSAYAGNLVSVGASLGVWVDNSTGAQGEDVFATNAAADNAVTVTAAAFGATIAGFGAAASGSGQATALNGIDIAAYVGDNDATVSGIDPLNVYAINATATNVLIATASSSIGGPASAEGFGTAWAGNTISVLGSLGTSVSDGVGVHVTGDIYAYNALANNAVTVTATAMGATIAGFGATASGTAGATALNTIDLAGLIGDNSDASYGIHPVADVYAESASANDTLVVSAVATIGGPAIATGNGSAYAANSISALGSLGNSVTDSSGLEIDGYVAAETAHANNAVTITAASGGTTIAGLGATASGTAGATALDAVDLSGYIGNYGSYSNGVDPTNIYAQDSVAHNILVVDATVAAAGPAVAGGLGSAYAGNLISVTGSLGNSVGHSTGVGIGNDMAAETALATNNVTITALALGATIAGFGATATGTASAAAVNGISIAGYIGNLGNQDSGVDPNNLYAEDATANDILIVTATSSVGGPAIADGIGSAYAMNTISVTGSLGNSVTDSTGVDIGGVIEAETATASDFVTVTASAGGDTLAGFGSTATATSDVMALNSVSLVGIVGAHASGSYGIDAGNSSLTVAGTTATDVVVADATTTIGGPAVASGDGSAYAGNLILISGSLGNGAVNTTGVDLGGVVAARDAVASDYVTITASAGGATVSGLGVSATGSGSAVAVNGVSIAGYVGNQSSGSYGVDPTDIYAWNASATDFVVVGATSTIGGPAVASGDGIASAANTVAVMGSLGNSVTNSTGVVASGDVYARDAIAQDFVTVTATAWGDTVAGFGASASAIGSASALNSVDLTGIVGNHGTGSYGIDPQQVYALNASATNSVTATATATMVGGPAIASGEGIAYAGNLISAVGSLGNSVTNSTGIVISSDVFSEYAAATNTVTVLASAPGGIDGFGATATGIGSATAVNGITISGLVDNHASGSYGVDPALVYARFATANNGVSVTATSVGSGIAIYGGPAVASGEGAAYAQNVISVTGSLGDWASNSTGVELTGFVTAGYATATNYVGVSAVAGGDPSVTLGASASGDGTALALNSIDLSGIVDDHGSGSFGIDPPPSTSVYATYAIATETVDVAATSTVGGPAIADGSGLAYAGNLVSVVGSLGNNVSGSTGVDVPGDVYAVTATANDQVLVAATAGGLTIGGAGATATGIGSSTALNAITISGTVGNNGLNDFGIDPVNVYADNASALELVQATATSTIGGPAIASADATASAGNLISVYGVLGNSVSDSTGAEISGDVYAIEAYASNTAVATAYGGSTIAGFGATATADGIGLATNGITIVGIVGSHGTDAYGVDPANVFAAGSQAVDTVVANATSTLGGAAVANASGIASASNLVSILGSIGEWGYDSTGVGITGDVSATITSALNIVTATALSGTDLAQSSVGASAMAVNGIDITGTVGNNSSGSYGVDPLGVQATQSTATDLAVAVSTATLGGLALADAESVNFSGNLISIVGDVGKSVTSSTGVTVGGEVLAQDAYGNDTLQSFAASYGTTIAGAGATATATEAAAVQNGITISGSVGDNSASSYGVDPTYVVAADAYGSDTVVVTALSSIGGPALAVSEAYVSAGNLIDISGVVGDTVSNSDGVDISQRVVSGNASEVASVIVSASVDNSGQTIGTGTATAHSSLTAFAGNGVGISGEVGTQSSYSTGVNIGANGPIGTYAANANVSVNSLITASSTDSGLASADAQDLVQAQNLLVISGVVGDASVHDPVATHNSTGVSIQGEGAAYDASATATQIVTAAANIDGNTINNGGAVAVGVQDVYTTNAIAVSGLAVAEGYSNTGVTIGGLLEAHNATASAVQLVSATSYNGEAADATATGNVIVGNAVAIEGVVGNYNNGSMGVHIGGVVYATDATVTASMQATATADESATPGPIGPGGATAVLDRTIAASNQVSITGSVGADGYYGNSWYNNPHDVNDTGVRIDGGVYASNAYASTAGVALATSVDGAPSTVLFTLTTQAVNAVAISGTVGPWSEGSNGVVVNGDVYAANASAFQSGTASASSSIDNASLAASGAQAILIDSVLAQNSVSIDGGVGTYAEGSTGVDPVSIYATNASADGSHIVAAGTFNGGDANATGDSLVSAANTISVSGSVGTFAESSTGVVVTGAVYATNAESSGFILASADTENGIGPFANGTATATANGIVLASNGIYVSGSVGDFGYNSVGVDPTSIYADGASAEGMALATATSSLGGSALANASGTVQALNFVTVVGSVGDYADYAGGVEASGDVYAANATATGTVTAGAVATNQPTQGIGDATATAVGSVLASNGVSIEGSVGYDSWYASGVDPVAVYAANATASGLTEAYATVSGAAGTPTANAAGTTEASNFVIIGGSVADWAEGSTGVGASGDVYATNASAADVVIAGAATSVVAGAATASSDAIASNVVSIMGTVGNFAEGSIGVDPYNVYATNASASSGATATVSGGGSATADALATAGNTVSVVGLVGSNSNGALGVGIDNDVSAAGVTISALATASGSTLADATATAIGTNSLYLFGGVGSTSSSATGIYIGGDVYVGGFDATSEAKQLDGPGSALTNMTLTNLAAITGTVGNYSTLSDGVHIGGDVYVGGPLASAATYTTALGTGAFTSDGNNFVTVTGIVGTNSDGSHGVYIGGGLTADTLISTVTIAGADMTDWAGSRGVWIGGNVTTGDALHSDFLNDAGLDGDRVTMIGSIYVGGSVSTGAGNDQVLVQDTNWQMTVVGGFDGGSNPDPLGQDLITFDNARTFVTNIDNFELMNVKNHSWVILQNNTPYVYAVRDQTNVYGNSILSLGSSIYDRADGDYTGNPGAQYGQFDTPILTIGGDPLNNFTVKNPTADDSVLQAEFDGEGSYVVNGDVYNFGTITLSQILSQQMGGLHSGPFDSLAAQEYWAVHKWNMDLLSGEGDILTINGDYTAGSDLILDAYVKKQIPLADQLIINGSVSGVTTIWVNNTNDGSGAKTGHGPTDGIELVEVNGPQTPAQLQGKFVLGNKSGWNFFDPIQFPDPELQVGAYIYKLYQVGPTGTDFYLQSDLLDQVPAYTVMSTAIQNHWYAELGTLYQRLGEVRHGEDSAAKLGDKGFEAWIRGIGQKITTDPAGDGFRFDQGTAGFMVGGDYTWKNAFGPNTRVMSGLFAGYGWSDLSNIHGAQGKSTADTKGYTVGAYATYYDTAKKGEGLYGDAVIKANFLDSSYKSSTRHTSASSGDTALGASLEVGYGFGFAKNFLIQPQGQLSYVRVLSDSFTEHSPGDPLHVDRSAADSLRGRAGLQLQGNFEDGETQISPYVIGNVLHEFLGRNKTTVAGSSFTNDVGGTWFNVGAGVSVDIRNVGFYGELGYSFGQFEGVNGSAGVKLRF